MKKYINSIVSIVKGKIGKEEIEIKKIFEINGIKVMLHKQFSEFNDKGDPFKKWVIAEYKTGYAIESGATVNSAIGRAESILNWYDIHSQKKMDNLTKKRKLIILNK